MRMRRAVSAFAVLGSAFVIALAVAPGRMSAEQRPVSPAMAGNEPLRMNVNEVVVTFHATGADGATVNDLKAEEIRIRDNGLAPRRIVAFAELVNRPFRVGILLDASQSVQQGMATNKEIAKDFVKKLFRQHSDEGFVSSFGYGTVVLQPWSGEPLRIVQGIESAREENSVPGGTALFNAVFRACSYSFDGSDPTATGNVVLLFSDGEDNAGLTSMEEAARACQTSNTAVFAFLSVPSTDPGSSGPRALRELAAKTGGRVYRADNSEEAIKKDLREIESEMRNQYRIVYNPKELKRDGAFHEIELQPPDRVSHVVVRSGYFAPRK